MTSSRHAHLRFWFYQQMRDHEGRKVEDFLENKICFHPSRQGFSVQDALQIQQPQLQEFQSCCDILIFKKALRI